MTCRQLTSIAVGLGAVAAPALAQDGHIGRGHEKWHSGFYMHLQRPDGKGSCCNLTDCRPTSGRVVDDHYEVKVDGVWTRVPQNTIVRRAAPDGGYHVCAQPNYGGRHGDILCVVVAPEG